MFLVVDFLYYDVAIVCAVIPELVLDFNDMTSSIVRDP